MTEPTRNAKDEPEKATLKAVVNTCLDRIEAAEAKQHQCPYGGEHWTESAWVRRRQLCGEQGWLCDRCKEDRADARAGVGNRLLALEEYATAIDARASSTEVDVQAMSTALADAQTRLAQVEVKLSALESRLPGPQTRTQDLGTFDSQTGQRVDEPTQHGEARTCGNCGHGSRFTPGCSENWVTRCGAPLPMWAGQGNVNVPPDQDATHCAAWTRKEAGNAI